MLVDDEQPVGELASHRADETFGVAVRPRTPRRDLHDIDPSVRENGIERSGELAGPVTNQKSKLVGPVVQLHEEVASLLCGPRAVRVGGGAEDVDVAGADLHHEEHVHPLQRDGAVDMEEVARQHGLRLSTQKPPPRRVGVPNSVAGTGNCHHQRIPGRSLISGSRNRPATRRAARRVAGRTGCFGSRDAQALIRPPPSAWMFCPVIQRLSSDARNTVTGATSS
ncbi:hypothetical protein SAMN04488564_117103 [Lentzea waywayandensis]|uniref:Uncharacterized protein n=1 Tax=Lentzea waywayandensis TaxID=84724 RepID=A0A1I6FGV2_9PSEU|nr:hypothetical protein SAMN04488564_117103 [Lentzea waywayandensis]